MFNTTNRLLNPAQSGFPAQPSAECEKYFSVKINYIRSINLPKCVMEFCYLSFFQFPRQIFVTSSFDTTDNLILITELGWYLRPSS